MWFKLALIASVLVLYQIEGKFDDVILLIEDEVYRNRLASLTINSNTSLIETITDYNQSFGVIVKNAKFLNLPNNSVTDKKNLKEFSVLFSNLETIEPGAFRNLPTLKIIMLNRNYLQMIDQGVFNGLLSVKELNLDHNKITVIHPDAFVNMPNLKIVSLDDNKLQSIDNNWFRTNPLLTYVSLDSNNLTVIPDKAFKFIGKEEYEIRSVTMTLSFNSNKIYKIIPTAFEGIKYIDELNLQNNALETLPEVLGDVESIKTLKVGGNTLKWRWYGLFDTVVIDKFVYWDTNNCIPIKVFESLLAKVGTVTAERCVNV